MEGHYKVLSREKGNKTHKKLFKYSFGPWLISVSERLAPLVVELGK